MHAVVSLFDEHTTEAIKNLWTELANDFGVRQLAEMLPYPHFSYQIASLCWLQSISVPISGNKPL